MKPMRMDHFILIFLAIYVICQGITQFNNSYQMKEIERLVIERCRK